jgi:hypothetical protein
MIEIFDSKTIYDLLSCYTENNNCTLVYFKNVALECCKDEELKNKVFAFYEEFLPEDMLLILKRQTYSAVQFKSIDEAIINITSWFPSRDLVQSDEYYWYACVIDNYGDIVFENRSKLTKEEL